MPGPRARLLARLSFAAAVVAVAAITLWPSPVDEGGRPTLLLTLDRLHARGLPLWFDYLVVEWVANVVMFVPLGALLAFLLGPGRRWLAVGVLAAMSTVVELAQHVALPRRFASAWDVLANTSGAVLGVMLVLLLVASARARGRSDPVQDPSTTGWLEKRMSCGARPRGDD